MVASEYELSLRRTLHLRSRNDLALYKDPLRDKGRIQPIRHLLGTVLMVPFGVQIPLRNTC